MRKLGRGVRKATRPAWPRLERLLKNKVAVVRTYK
jgi:hypothetical protein